MEPERAVDAEIFPSYGQFALVDVSAEWHAPAWDGAELERHLGTAPGLVGVGTLDTDVVPVRIEAWAVEPPLDDGWDHVVEASLDVTSGAVGLAEVDGPDEIEPLLALEPGSYRVRSSAGGLDDAQATGHGARYRLQLWPTPSAEPQVRLWWPPWDPAGARAEPTTTGGRLLLGAEAHDARARMEWLASRGTAHLFRDAEGALWEHSNPPDAAGMPQLEELAGGEAERRYGAPGTWRGAAGLGRLDLGSLLKNVRDTIRYAQGWRPEPDPAEPVEEDGRRTYVGTTAMNRLVGMRWLASEGGHGLYGDAAGGFWEFRTEDAAAGRPRLRELTRDEAEAKYGPRA